MSQTLGEAGFSSPAGIPSKLRDFSSRGKLTRVKTDTSKLFEDQSVFGINPGGFGKLTHGRVGVAKADA